MAQKTSTKKPTKTSPKKPAASVKKAPVATRTSVAKAKPKSASASKAAPRKSAASNAVSAKEGKREKVPTTLSKSDLQYFRNLLLEKRRELLGDVGSMESEAFKSGSNLSNMPIHMADVGTDNFEQEFTLGLIESERQFPRDIQEALIRIDDGTYGICQGTGKPIPRVRLEAVPWAKYTIEYSRLLESGKISRESGGADDESGGDEDEE
jgi:RNA polymerase-binding protein DksA